MAPMLSPYNNTAGITNFSLFKSFNIFLIIKHVPAKNTRDILKKKYFENVSGKNEHTV